VNKKDWAEFVAVREKWSPMMERPETVQAQLPITGAVSTR
jgi:hypothetical protein